MDENQVKSLLDNSSAALTQADMAIKELLALLRLSRIELRTTTEFTRSELDMLVFLSRGRYITNRNAGIVDRQMGPQGSLCTDLEGLIGEIGFCKLIDRPPDTTLHPRQGGNNIVIEGARVDTKSTRHPFGRLLVARNKDSRDVDVFVLMIIDYEWEAPEGATPPGGREPRLRSAWAKYCGWAWADEILQEARVKDLGYGPTYAMDQFEIARSWPPMK